MNIGEFWNERTTVLDMITARNSISGRMGDLQHIRQDIQEEWPFFGLPQLKASHLDGYIGEGLHGPLFTPANVSTEIHLLFWPGWVNDVKIHTQQVYGVPLIDWLHQMTVDERYDRSRQWEVPPLKNWLIMKIDHPWFTATVRNTTQDERSSLGEKFIENRDLMFIHIEYRSMLKTKKGTFQLEHFDLPLHREYLAQIYDITWPNVHPATVMTHAGSIHSRSHFWREETSDNWKTVQNRIWD